MRKVIICCLLSILFCFLLSSCHQLTPEEVVQQTDEEIRQIRDEYNAKQKVINDTMDAIKRYEEALDSLNGQ